MPQPSAGTAMGRETVARRRIRSVPIAPLLDVLSEDRAEQVHDATLRLLRDSGIGLSGTGASALARRLQAAGARVADGRVRLPAELVQEALDCCPRRLTLAARDPDLDLRLDGTRAWLSVDGCAAEVLEPGADDPRPSTAADVETLTRIADGLEEIAFVWQPVAARDAPQAVASLHELRAQLRATRKHVQMMTASTPLAAAGVVQMARAAAGGADELRRRPVVSSFQCSVSPMSYEASALEAGVLMAEAGIPCGFTVMPIAGASAPITPLGALLQTNAEIVAGVTMLQLLVPGTATFYGACTTVMDLQTGAATCGGPEDLFFQGAAARMARRYGLPAHVGTFATGSRRSDWQAGLENGVSGLVSLLAGAQLLSGAGLLEGASVFSAEQMVLDAESFGLLADLLELRAGSGGDDELDAAADLIADVGPGGHFLDRDHTLEHMSCLWRPRTFTREGREEWDSAGRPGPRERARGRIEEILGAAAPPATDEDLRARMDEVVAEFEDRARHEEES